MVITTPHDSFRDYGQAVSEELCLLSECRGECECCVVMLWLELGPQSQTERVYFAS